MQIQVTQEHINRGRKSDRGKCPIALAIKDAIGWRNIKHLSVGRILVDINNITQIEHNQNFFIDIFDFPKFNEKRKISPISFDLDIPKEMYKECTH